MVIAAESSPLPTAREVVVRMCRFPGCENLEARSDGKCNRHSLFRPLSGESAAHVNERLKAFAPEAADLAMEAARVSAKDGDHKAAAWILTHSGVVKPVGPSQSDGGGGQRQVVQVGIILPGLPGAEA